MDGMLSGLRLEGGGYPDDRCALSNVRDWVGWFELSSCSRVGGAWDLESGGIGTEVDGDPAPPKGGDKLDDSAQIVKGFFGDQRISRGLTDFAGPNGFPGA